MISGAKTNEMVERAKLAVQRLSHRITDIDKESKSNMKINFLLENRFTLWKAYVLDRSLIITSLGALLTYGILIGTLDMES
ncbi:hypothetical protein CEXT_553341 [Caerostris extrusa]|uniref:Gustatory receptor n=1 Tax=Caerostris extrusa TaxID=172846 RepID=A0AAV4XV14_CAEEX|nr:hypothetical protein CEXT_553341 [Caerostris extrusa]